MKSNKYFKLLILLLLLLSLSGCWSRRELDELGIATVIGTDKKDNA